MISILFGYAFWFWVLIWVCCCELSVTVFSFPHHESRVGSLYNAVVPPFNQEVANGATVYDKDVIPYGGFGLLVLSIDTVFEPTEIEEELVNNYIKQGRELVARNDDFLLQVLYESDFDTTKALRTLKRVFPSFLSHNKVALNAPHPLFQKGRLPYYCSCFRHTCMSFVSY